LKKITERPFSQDTPDIFPNAGLRKHILKYRPLPSTSQVLHSIGYGGFVPHIKAENMFSESFGKTTGKSLQGNLHIGQDVPPNIKYTSLTKQEFVDHQFTNAPTVAATVGVDKGKPSYKPPLDSEDVHKFFGIEQEQWNESLKRKTMEKNQTISNKSGECTNKCG